MRALLVATWFGLLTAVGGGSTAVAASLELYGTFHAMGVIVHLDATDDPDADASAAVQYRESGGSWQGGFPLIRVADTRFVGSLFWLEPDSSYEVQVTFDDADGVLHGVMVAATASTRSEIVIPAPQDSWVVSPGGSGTTCSAVAPCALAEGIDRAQPGDEVRLRDGVYLVGELELPRSGSAGAPVVLRAWPGETPILDGADPATFSWTATGEGVYSTTVNTPDPHLVAVGGERLYPYQSLSDLQNLVWGVPGFYAAGTSVWVRLDGNADPNAVSMVVSRFNHALLIERDHIAVIGLTFRHYGGGSYAKGIYLNNANDVLIRGCTFHLCDLGIGIKRASHRNVIEDNQFSDTIFDWPWQAVKAGSQLETGGVRFYDPATGRGNVIRRNTFHDDFDGFGVCPGSTAAMTNETDVYDNLVFDVGDDGVETDGQCSNVRMWGNTFHDVLIGISLAPVYTGPVYALRNLVYRTGVGNNSYSGSAFKFNSGYDQSGPMILVHNTSDAVLAGNDALAIKSPGTWTSIWARNNIWSGTEYAISNANPTQPLDLDWDCVWTSQAGELAWWSGLPDRHLNDLAELQVATGHEQNGIEVAPAFTNAAGGQYTLQAGSDLVDRGLLIPGLNHDFAGSAPDLGAFESGVGNLEVLTNVLPPAAVNRLYDQSLVATGGTPPYAWAISDGAPPTDINLQPDGTLTGTPTVLGGATFTVEVTDTAGPPATDDQLLALLVTRAGDCTGDLDLDAGDLACTVAVLDGAPATGVTDCDANGAVETVDLPCTVSEVWAAGS